MNLNENQMKTFKHWITTGYPGAKYLKDVESVLRMLHDQRMYNVISDSRSKRLGKLGILFFGNGYYYNEKKYEISEENFFIQKMVQHRSTDDYCSYVKDCLFPVCRPDRQNSYPNDVRLVAVAVSQMQYISERKDPDRIIKKAVEFVKNRMSDKKDYSGLANDIKAFVQQEIDMHSEPGSDLGSDGESEGDHGGYTISDPGCDGCGGHVGNGHVGGPRNLLRSKSLSDLDNPR